ECRKGTLGLGPLSTSVKSGGLWHLAHPPAPLNTSCPRRAAAWLKLPSAGGGVGRPSWYRSNAGGLGVTRSVICLMLIPIRGSLRLPCPPICVTPTYFSHHAPTPAHTTSPPAS